MGKSFTLGEFLKTYGSDYDCLKEIVNIKYPDGVPCKKCNCITPHYLLKTRPVLSCSKCHNQINPLKGTIFEKTTTPLKLWFYAFFVMIHSKGGISAKGLQRQLGVTYKTSFRILHKIRGLMADNSGDLFKGVVEVDETWVGGKSWLRGKQWWSNWKEIPKQTVMGFVEREGRVRTTIIDDTSRWTLTKQIKANIDPKARVISDQHHGYANLEKEGYNHDRINHMVHYVDKKDKTIHTQTIEGFWSQLKRGIIGTYRHVSPKYLQNYCDEFGFRYGNRRSEDQFMILLGKI